MLWAPVLTDEIVGRVVFYCADEPGGEEKPIATLPLYADRTVELPRRPSLLQRVRAFFARIFHKK